MGPALQRGDGGGDRGADLPVTDVADVTGLPAILGHRVVTLHPKIHGGILADLDDPEHRTTSPSTASADRPRRRQPVPVRSDPSVELIDIGGPAMVRAAAKNHAHVGVVVDPAEYGTVLAEITASGGLAHRRGGAWRAAFAATAAYDTAIVDWLDGEVGGAGGEHRRGPR